jgi:hypothetical protein
MAFGGDPRWHVELELNPPWLRTSGSNAFGGHGLIGGGATVGRVSLAAGAFVFYNGVERTICSVA